MVTRTITLVMGCFTKTGEWFYKRSNHDVKNYKNRARNICNPDPTLLGTCNQINYICLKLLKIVCPEYSSYLNMNEL